MCIAIYKPEGKIVTKAALSRSFTVNSDGAGYVFANNGELIIKKGFFRFAEFWKAFRKDMSQYGNPTTLIHFRIATHGRVDGDNCHPFAIGKEYAFIHNGVIDCAMLEKDMSDTFNFGKYTLAPIVAQFGKGILESQAMGDLIGMAIGYSKLAIIDSDGEVTLVNSDMGTWEHGVWYSNDSYKPKGGTRRYPAYTNWNDDGDSTDDDIDARFAAMYDNGDEDFDRVARRPVKKYDEPFEIAQRFKANKGELESLDLSGLKGLSFDEISRMSKDEFVDKIVSRNDEAAE